MRGMTAMTADPEDSSRPRRTGRRAYHQHGRAVVSKALPYLMERVTDPAIADGELTPVERAARTWRMEVITDLGGLEAVPAARIALLDAAVGSKVILDSLDRYVFELAAQSGLANRRSRRVFAVVTDRMRVADSLARQLQALGLERRDPKPLDLGSYLASRYGTGGPPGAEGGESPSPPSSPSSPDRDPSRGEREAEG